MGLRGVELARDAFCRRKGLITQTKYIHCEEMPGQAGLFLVELEGGPFDLVLKLETL